MINILELAESLATIAALRAETHCLHHGQVELGRSIGCTAVTGFRVAAEVQVVVVEAGRTHIGGSGSGCFMYRTCGWTVDGVDVAEAVIVVWV